MSDSYLLLSSPPHGNADAAKLAPFFEMTPAETRVKLNYPASTIWFADPDLTHLQQVAKSLRSGGANIRLIKGRSLTVLSKRHRFRKFKFGEDGLHCWVDADRKVVIPYTWSVNVISCRPMATEQYERQTLRQTVKSGSRNKSIRQDAKAPLSQIKEPVDDTFVDIYFYQLPKVHRFTTRPGETDFSGLGPAMKHSVSSNIAELVSQISNRFSNVLHTRSMENLPAPRSSPVGQRPLSAVLGEIDPDLSDIGPFDLVSRLCFLAHAST